MKLVIPGKGGVGKSTLASAIILPMAHRGRNVGAVDADRDGSSVLNGLPDDLHRCFEDIINRLEATL